MTLKEYIGMLQKLEREGHGDKTVVYAADDEGNGFSKVHYAPALGLFKDHGGWGEFDNSEGAKKKANAVCVN